MHDYKDTYIDFLNNELGKVWIIKFGISNSRKQCVNDHV